MPRPRLVNAATLILTLYTQTPSVREVARRTRLSRWTVLDRLHAAGVAVLSKEDAADLKRYLDRVHAEQQAARVCVAPNCLRYRAALDPGLCAPCRRQVDQPRPPAGGCVWCGAETHSGRLCYRCRKLAEGRMSR